MTWRPGPGGALTWRAGPPRACDAALRPRGKATGGPREAQEAHRARTRGRRPRVSTGPRGRPCGAQRGRRGLTYGGPTGSWALVRSLGRAPIFILTIFIYLFRVGLCPTYVFFRVGFVRTAEIAWTRVHAIIKSGTCAKYNLSDGNRKGYLTPHGDTRNVYLHQREDRTIAI